MADSQTAPRTRGSDDLVHLTDGQPAGGPAHAGVSPFLGMRSGHWPKQPRARGVQPRTTTRQADHPRPTPQARDSTPNRNMPPGRHPGNNQATHSYHAECPAQDQQDHSAHHRPERKPYPSSAPASRRRQRTVEQLRGEPQSAERPAQNERRTTEARRSETPTG